MAQLKGRCKVGAAGQAAAMQGQGNAAASGRAAATHLPRNTPRRAARQLLTGPLAAWRGQCGASAPPQRRQQRRRAAVGVAQGPRVLQMGSDPLPDALSHACSLQKRRFGLGAAAARPPGALARLPHPQLACVRDAGGNAPGWVDCRAFPSAVSVLAANAGGAFGCAWHWLWQVASVLRSNRRAKADGRQQRVTAAARFGAQSGPAVNLQPGEEVR